MGPRALAARALLSSRSETLLGVSVVGECRDAPITGRSTIIDGAATVSLASRKSAPPSRLAIADARAVGAAPVRSRSWTARTDPMIPAPRTLDRVVAAF